MTLVDCGVYTCEAPMIKPQNNRKRHRRRPVFNIPVNSQCTFYMQRVVGQGTEEKIKMFQRQLTSGLSHLECIGPATLWLQLVRN